MTKESSDSSLTSFADHLNEQYGERGTPTREEFEKGFEVFKAEVILQEFAKEKYKLSATDQKPSSLKQK
jgi:hypothetical protein